MLVYLADLRHKTITLSPDAIPLAIGYLAAHGTKVLGPEIQFKLFVYPEHLLEELKHTKPDVLAVANYCWGYALHCRFLHYAQGLYPDLLTVMGGPNISLDPEGEEARLRQTPGLDVYIIGEGEQAFVSLLSRYLDSGLDKARLFQKPLLSAIFIAPDSGQVVRGTPTLRLRNLDELPSPYLLGFMDQFFDGAFCPMIQTNRGCPFTCTFCVEGVGYMTKVNKFSIDRVREELKYIARYASIGSALMIADSNFGMLPGDLDTAQSIHDLQEQIGWPKFLWATTGKNKKEAILAAMDRVGGAMMMTNSVQSMDPNVLANIKRSNIKLEIYNALQQEVQRRNLQSYAEIIIALPGETRESLLRGVCQLLDSGVNQVACYQLMLLDGTEMINQVTRDKYCMKTKFRIFSRDFGIYAGEPVAEIEEIVVETNTLSHEDYMECRKLQLILEVYHREGLFRELLEYLRIHNVPVSAFIMDLLAHLYEAPEGVRRLFGDYLSESRDELFDSPGEARRFMAENYHRLVEEEEVGGNLIQKYSALAWFKTLGPVLDYGIQRARALVLAKPNQDAHAASQVDGELEAVRQYLLAAIINIVDISNQLEDVVVPLEYDFEGWRHQRYQRPLLEFQHPPLAADNGATPEAREYVFYISEDHAAYLEDKLRMHGTSTQAVGKLLSRVLLRDLRRQVKAQYSE